jgi:SAM-dependent methyltransferase
MSTVAAGVRHRCEICGATGRRRLWSKRGYEFYRCETCGHVFTGVGLTAAELSRVYDQSFFLHGPYSDYVKDRPIYRRNFRRFLSHILRRKPEGTLLEIGCAYGFFLEMAGAHWKCTGIDISEHAVGFARETLGVDARCGDFLDAPFPAGSFDVVVLWDTIEHVQFPSRYMANIAEVLNPGGIVALTTGDAGSVVARARGVRWRLVDPPYHLHYFTRRTLGTLLASHGLSIMEIEAVGYWRSLDVVFHRVFVVDKPRSWRLVYEAARFLRLTSLSFYTNLFDIMLVVARKSE